MDVPDAREALVMPASGARRLRSTSTASALSGETYRTRHRCFGGSGGSNISRFRHHRNAVNVLPLPVGARMSVDSPRAMAGQPSSCGRVGDGNDATNHSRTEGWNRSSTWPRAITRSKHVRAPNQVTRIMFSARPQTTDSLNQDQPWVTPEKDLLTRNPASPSGWKNGKKKNGRLDRPVRGSIPSVSAKSSR